MVTTLKKLFYILDKKDKNEFLKLILLISVISVIDVAGVASIMPFISLVSSPEIIETNSYLQYFYNFFEFDNSEDFIFYLGVFFAFLLLASSFLKILTMWFLNYFSMMKEYSIGINILNKYLKYDYLFFTSRHSGNLGKVLLSDVGFVINQNLLPFLNTISQLITVSLLLLLLLYIDPTVTIFTFLFFGSIFFIIYYKSKKLLTRIGSEGFANNELRFKYVSEIFSGIKQIKIEGLEKWYLDIFASPSFEYAKTQVYAATIKNSPKYILEGLVFATAVIFILYLLASGNNLIDFLPKITLFVFSGYKFLPALQQLFSFIAGIKYTAPIVNRLYKDYTNLQNYNISDESSNKFPDNLKFQIKDICIKDVFFAYTNSKYIFQKLSLVIPSKKAIGIIGKSGSGKTTLIDLIIGLIKPEKGNILINGKNNEAIKPELLKGIIGYVPQNIFIIDGTIMENIAFGVAKDEIDIKKVIEAAKKAEIYDFINNELQSGFETSIGEKGVRFSGGQLQRIGIARALYKNPSLLILDESTSALDISTEESIMKTIYSLKKSLSILIVSHRPSTIKDCDQVLLIKSRGKITMKNFSDLFYKKNGFYKYKSKI